MNHRPLGTMIFAAGFGTRMRPLTNTRPKPLIQVAGQSLLDHAIELAQHAKADPIVVNAHYLADQVENHLHDSDIILNVESPQILDTGGGLKAALPRFDQLAVLTLNSDMIWRGPNPLLALQDAWQPDHMDALLLTVPVAQAFGTKSAGDFSISESGKLTRGGPHLFTGAQIIKTSAVRDWPEDVFSLNVVWNEIATTGHLFGVPYEGQWCDVGTPDGIRLAEDLLAGSFDV